MRIKTDQTGRYMQVAKPNGRLIWFMLEECRGNEQRSKFSAKTGVNNKFFAKNQGRLRVVPFTDNVIENVIRFEDPESTVTKQQMMAANGMVSVDEVERVRRSFLLEKKDKKDLRYREFYDPEDRKHRDRMEMSDYDELIDDLAFFARRLDYEDAFMILQCHGTFLRNPSVVVMLHKYHEHVIREREQRQVVRETYFSSEKRKEDTLPAGRPSNIYAKYLTEMLIRDHSWM